MANKVAPESFDFPEISDPANPPAGFKRVYANSDGMKQRNSAGVETPLNGITGNVPNDTHAIARFNDLTGQVLSSSYAYLYDSGEIDIYLQDAAAAGLFIIQHATQTEAPLIIADSALNRQTILAANGGAVFNEEGNDVDFRVETDTNANALFVDGGNNNVGMGTGTPDASALLDLVSTVKGLGLPSMTTAQRTAIGSPRDGLVVYDSDLDLVYVRANGAWVAVGGGTSDLPEPITGVFTIASGYSRTESNVQIASGGELIIAGSLYIV